MKFLKIFPFLLSLFFLTGCIGNMSSGQTFGQNYPYFITKEPLKIKKIVVPTGTKLIYETGYSKEGEQDKMMSEELLTTIELPAGKTIDWGGVPVTSIDKFFNSEMCGFSVYADFKQLSNDKKTKFSELWQSCNDDLGITVKNIDDWSFNKNNILDIESCGVNYQRYFKENAKQQKFLDNMYSELMKINSK